MLAGFVYEGEDMNGKHILYIDQYGQHFSAATVKELRECVGGGRVSKMYMDGGDGKTYHVGYVIGNHWLSAYVPFSVEA